MAVAHPVVAQNFAASQPFQRNDPILMRGLVLGLALAFIVTAGSARADCSIAAFERTRALVEGFMFEQGSLLREFPRGGPSMRYRVSVIAASSKAAVPQILRLIAMGNIEQRQAAGAGLALATRLCEKRQSHTARWLEKTAKAYPDPVFLREFEKYYKSREDIQSEIDDALRAATLRKQIDAVAPGAGSMTDVGRSVRLPIDGALKPIGPILQVK